MAEKYPWRDETALREHYIGEEMSTREIAEMWDTNRSVISDWLDRHNIPSRASKQDSEGPWQDEEKLRELYTQKELSTYEIAERLGCGQTTIRRWLNRHGIETRGDVEALVMSRLRRPAPFYTDPDGYEEWRTKLDGKTFRMKVHRLLAVSEYGAEAVADKVVHHKNGVPWDNRPDNIEVMTASEHSTLHNTEGMWR